MKKLTFELEFITPAFLGGADPLKPELRPASFVGLLRFWWRALKSECNIEELKEEETKIFGGNGKYASKVAIRVWGNVDLKEEPFKSFYRLDWSFDKNHRTLRGPHSGIGYLFFSTMLRDRVKGFIPAGSRFSISFVGEESYLNHYVASLWALVFLGGVGSRSRRGGGNLTVIDHYPKDLQISFTPKAYFGEWLVENLKKAKELVGSSKTPCSEYSNLSNIKIVLSPKEFNTWIEALNDIGNRFMNLRVKNRKKIFETASFGIPVRHSNGQFVEAEQDIKRRSSPIIIKLAKTTKGKYMWMVSWLSGRFLPKDVKLVFGRDKQFPNFGLVEEFFQELEKED